MKKIFVLIICLSLGLLASACQNTQTRATEGAVVGGVLGAAAGGIIGHQSHHGAEGAGIGAAVGVISGAIIGIQIQKQPAQTGQAAPATQTASSNQMTIQQVVDLTKQGAHEAVIIDKIHLSNSKFTLTPEDIAYLKQQGVSQKVIDAMQGL
jgi:uncharacterized protein YcfJ